MKRYIIKAITILVIIVFPLFGLVHILSAKGAEAESALAAASLNSSASPSESVDLSAVEELDSHSVADIEKKISDAEKKEKEKLEKEKQKAKLKEAKSKRVSDLIKKVQSGETSYRQLLKGTVIAGDSLMHGMNEYKILDSSYLVTKVSANLKHLKASVPTIVNLNPKILVVHYGLNNMSTNDTEIKNFVSVYENILKDLHGKLPGTKIVVSSVFNVSSEKATGRYKDIAHFNSKLNEMCKRNGFTYLDNSGLISGKSSYYEQDGMHVIKKFYTEKFLPNLVVELGL